jgi:hypothetical protein
LSHSYMAGGPHLFTTRAPPISSIASHSTPLYEDSRSMTSARGFNLHSYLVRKWVACSPRNNCHLVIGEIWSRKKGLHLQRGLPTPKCPIISIIFPPIASRQQAIELHYACEGFRVSQRHRHVLPPDGTRIPIVAN